MSSLEGLDSPTQAMTLFSLQPTILATDEEDDGHIDDFSRSQRHFP